jgi:hypothetical protein
MSPIAMARVGYGLARYGGAFPQKVCWTRSEESAFNTGFWLGTWITPREVAHQAHKKHEVPRLVWLVLFLGVLTAVACFAGEMLI